MKHLLKGINKLTFTNQFRLIGDIPLEIDVLHVRTRKLFKQSVIPYEINYRYIGVDISITNNLLYEGETKVTITYLGLVIYNDWFDSLETNRVRDKFMLE